MASSAPLSAIESRLFPPELVMDHKALIALTAAPQDAITKELDRSQSELVKLQWELQSEKDKLVKTLGGIRDMPRTPQALWIVDTKKEHLAVDEARKLRIPVIGILDTNCDPDEVDFAVPGNDDAIRSVSLLTRVIADAVADGLVSRSGGQSTGDAGATSEPMPDWERELLGAQDEAAAPADAAPAAADEAPAAADEAPAESTEGETPAVQTLDEEAEAVAAAPDAAPVPADEIPAVVAAEADADAQPTEQGEHRTEA
jgi:small subunit ribosomal protein S2